MDGPRVSILFMLNDASRRKFDVVMAWAIDRLGRSLIDLLDTIQRLEACGVDLYLDQAAGGKEKSEPLPIASANDFTPAARPHCYPRGNCVLGFLGLCSSGPIALSAAVISRFDLRLGGSSWRGVVVAGAEVSTASPSITLASSAAARRSRRSEIAARYRAEFAGAQPFIGVYLLDFVLARNQQGANLQIGGRLLPRRTSATAFSPCLEKSLKMAQITASVSALPPAPSSGRFALNCFLVFQKGGVGGASSRRCSARNPEEGLRPRYANKEMAWAPAFKTVGGGCLCPLIRWPPPISCPGRLCRPIYFAGMALATLQLRGLGGEVGFLQGPRLRPFLVGYREMLVPKEPETAPLCLQCGDAMRLARKLPSVRPAVGVGCPSVRTVWIRRNQRARARAPTAEMASTETWLAIFPVSCRLSAAPMRGLN